MSKIEKTSSLCKRRKNEKLKDGLLLCGLAFALLLASWQVFYKEEETTFVYSESMTEAEQKVSYLLSEMDGVGENNVMIFETEDGIQSVVVICEGANNIQTNMDIRSAIAGLLGTDEKAIKIYLKKTKENKKTCQKK